MYKNFIFYVIKSSGQFKKKEKYQAIFTLTYINNMII